MGEIIYYIAVILFVGVVLTWSSDIKPRIFTNPDAVKLKPGFKLGLLIYTGCFLAAFTLFGVLVSVLPEDQTLRTILGILLTGAAIFFGNYFSKRKMHRIFFEAAISMHMEPEDYAKTLCPHYVTEYIESHLSDKEHLEKYIKHQKKLGHIPEYCAWAFLVAYCDKRP